MKKIGLAIVVSAVLGLISVVTPAFFVSAKPSHVAPLFPIVHVAIEQFGLAAVIGLFFAGLITRSVIDAPFWVIGPSTMLAFPIMAVAEVLVDPRSHSLFPIEVLLYCVESIAGVMGAVVGVFVYPVVRTLVKPSRSA